MVLAAGGLDMTELYNFIKSVKELDLYGAAHNTCCKDETDTDCSCTAKSTKDQDDLCMFDYCMSWTSLYHKMNLVNDAKNDGTLGLALVPSIGGFMAWMGMNKDFSFPNHVDNFYVKTGQVGMIVSAMLAAIYGAYPVLEASVKTEYYNTSANYIGANFLAYGGNNFVGDLLGLFEVSWVFSFLMLAADIALVPLILAYEMDVSYTKGLTGTEGQSLDFQYLLFAFLIAAGSWFSADAMKNSASRLIGFFDIQNTDGAAVYMDKFSTSEATAWSADGTWLVFDIIHHTVTVIGYFAVATALSVVNQVFVHVALTGEQQ
jgi:hypothetical protein